MTRWKRIVVIVCGLLLLPLVGLWVMIARPTMQANVPSSVQVAPVELEQHVRMLSETFHPRNHRSYKNLDRCVSYISKVFQQAGARVTVQPFEVTGHVYHNVIARFGSSDEDLIIVGAHYDSYADTPGADDNASGVAGLLALAKLLGQDSCGQNVELVAYCLEEPPYFRTQAMGSATHANNIAELGLSLKGVIVLEMIGYYTEEAFSQDYPIAALRLMYPSTGNFVAVVGRIDQGHYTEQVKVGMQGATDLPVYSISAPAELPGIDFSDHLSYWRHDMEAVMVTDTAFYRNKSYHELDDTWDRLNYITMSKVVIAVYEAIRQL